MIRFILLFFSISQFLFANSIADESFANKEYEKALYYYLNTPNYKKNMSICDNLSTIYFSKQNYKKAIYFKKFSIKLSKDKSLFIKNTLDLTSIYSKFNLDKEISTLYKIYTLYPEYSEIKLRLSYAYYRNNNFENSMRLLDDENITNKILNLKNSASFLKNSFNENYYYVLTHNSFRFKLKTKFFPFICEGFYSHKKDGEISLYSNRVLIKRFLIKNDKLLDITPEINIGIEDIVLSFLHIFNSKEEIELKRFGIYNLPSQILYQNKSIKFKFIEFYILDDEIDNLFTGLLNDKS